VALGTLITNRPVSDSHFFVPGFMATALLAASCPASKAVDRRWVAHGALVGMQQAYISSMAGLACHINLAVANHGRVVRSGVPDQHIFTAKNRSVRVVPAAQVLPMAGNTLVTWQITQES
jgi:hypothetical protein